METERVGSNEGINSIQINSKMKSFFIRPCANGLCGFILFFLLILLMKFLQQIFGTERAISIELEDILLSAIGFILLFLIAFLKNFRQDAT
ncbi:hypothetical protein C0389_00030 [bacterium]|nr:hypothetical protein [bacterium]